MNLRKDESLDALAEKGNVAQFVSFVPGHPAPRQSYLRILGHAPNQVYADPRAAVASLFEHASDGTVNVRSYTPDSPRSREFVYGLATVDDAIAALNRLTDQGLFTIVNETINVNDGGVSGVIQGGVVEFAPDDTPRCVEKPGTASLPEALGFALLRTVYGFSPDFGGATGRVEFSIHPQPRGWRATHTLLWEQEDNCDEAAIATLQWPNRFSRHIGDKLYGLLMAHLSGALVPRTTALSRRVAPFTFGTETSSHETWIRTCPTEQQPGLFTTHRGWLDPYKLMAEEDSDGTAIAAVLAQAGVPARFAGASIITADGLPVVEGIAGHGDAFMLGTHLPEELPQTIIADVLAVGDALTAIFGPVRTEWVHDGEKVWIVQLHRGATESTEHVLVPGERAHWIGFDAASGLEAFRTLLADINGESGVEIVGSIGMTSHMADIARKSGIPTRVVAA